jgi:signal transduction histidine kinase
MSFRLRVGLLTVLTVLTATAATAWFTLRQAKEVTRSVTASRQDIATITDELGAYGRLHGTWDGVTVTLSGLSVRTGQRIRVVTVNGTLLADTDVLAGYNARAVTGPSLMVDPRPTVQLPAGMSTEGLARVVGTAIYEYRRGWPLAACLTRAGAPVKVTSGQFGIPIFAAAEPASPAAVQCRGQLMPRTDKVDTFISTAKTACQEKQAQELVACLQRTFTGQISDIAPQQLQVYVGFWSDPPPRLDTRAAIVAVILVTAAAIVSSLLVSRRVLRPISALTTASRRLGAGERTERVPVAGRDELAELGRTFNHMADSLQRSEDRQRQMIADVAHELRTPLANLRGYLEGLKDGVLPPSPGLFASLHDEALLQQRIVDDLQDLALAEAGALAYHRDHVDLADLLETCRTAHAALAEASGTALVVEIGARAEVHGDPDRLRQVLGNLVRNAVTATRAGDTITLRLGAVDGSATIVVADTGTGIAEADLPHLFDRFWRADRSRRRTPGGTGLGLAIARQIVADHGGTIVAASPPGVGTTFIITLPTSPPQGG